MTRWISLVGLVGVLAVDWAALNDIAKGREPSLWMEYTWLMVSLPVLVALGFLARRKGAARGER